MGFQEIDGGFPGWSSPEAEAAARDARAAAFARDMSRSAEDWFALLRGPGRSCLCPRPGWNQSAVLFDAAVHHWWPWAEQKLFAWPELRRLWEGEFGPLVHT